MMPKSFDNFPIFFSEKELNMLKGTDLPELIKLENKKVEEDFNIIRNEVTELDSNIFNEEQFTLR